jgi:membrane protease YdiL (CAAX protease family)
MNLVDHLMLFLLAVALPVAGVWSFRRFARQIEAGEPSDRTAMCRQTLFVQWSTFTILVLAWLAFRRPFADLGLVAPGGAGFFAGLLLLVPLLYWLVRAWRGARVADAGERAKFASELGLLQHFLPNTRESYRCFVGVSITAGIVEEIAYRGFAFWYFAHYLPPWAVVFVTAIAFGLGHLYQGIANALRVTLGGIAFGAYYLLTDSIWLPIVTHMLVDLLQGAMVYEYLRERPSSSAHEPAPAELPARRD